MKQNKFKLIIVMTVYMMTFYTNCLYASTYVESTLENKEIENIAYTNNLPSPSEILNIPFGFIGVFLKGFFMLGAFYIIATVICKFFINEKREIKSFITNKRLGKIMDRMYEYKRNAYRD